ncbi:MAG: hypothetical protein AAF850_05920 [Pseudomonadota bacterium]
MTLTPSIIQWILLGVVIEAVGLTALFIRFRRPRLIVPTLFFLLSGAALMGVVRELLISGAESAFVSPLMLASFFGHMAAIFFFARRV